MYTRENKTHNYSIFSHDLILRYKNKLSLIMNIRTPVYVMIYYGLYLIISSYTLFAVCSKWLAVSIYLNYDITKKLSAATLPTPRRSTMLLKKSRILLIRSFRGKIFKFLIIISSILYSFIEIKSQNI